jgi:hypothetical protein
MAAEQESRAAVSDIMRGLPQTESSMLTPAGQIEQAGKIAGGLRTPRDGWRKIVFRAGVIFLSAVAVLFLAVVIYAAVN